MNRMQTLMLRDLHRRNGLVFKAITAIAILAILAAVSLSQGQMLPSSTVLLVVTQLATIAIIGYLHYGRKLTLHIPYIAIGLSLLSSMSTIWTSPNFSSFFSIYYMLALSIIYMRMGPFLTGVGAGLVQLIWLLAKLGAQYEAAGDLRVSPVIYFILVSVVLFFFIRSSRDLFQEIGRTATEAEQLALRQQEQQQRLMNSISISSGNLDAVRQSAEENNQSFKQINVSFREIAAGAGDQVQSTITITESVQASNRMLQQMTDSFVQLLEHSEQANTQSVRGGQKVGELYSTMIDFQTSIGLMEEDIRQLNAAIREASGFSSMISDIAAQTGLLSLNASIEAARAGESGRGFAVVASEIRKLADSAGSSAEQISRNLTRIEQQSAQTGRMMSEISAQMRDSSEQTAETHKAFTGIGSSVSKLSDLVNSFEEYVQILHRSSASIEAETQAQVAVNEEASATLQELSATVDLLLAKNGEILKRLRETDQALRELV